MRSLLFIPGDSPRKLDKGLTSSADVLLLDLEDSIAPDGKTAARETTLAFLREAQTAKDRPRLYVRVNGFRTGLLDADLDVVMAGKPDGILLPKAEGGGSVTQLDAALTAREANLGIADGGTAILALTTETAKAMFLAGTYAGSSRRLAGLTWGAEDLSAELGAEANRDASGNFLDPYRLARTLCLVGAAAAQVPALDTVYVDFRKSDGLRRECEEARRDGFVGKMAIHPAQVPIINAVFSPTPDAIAHAHAIVDAFAAAGNAGVVGISGVMYDRPHLAKAMQLLARTNQAPFIPAQAGIQGGKPKT
jgi:citrate lyase subunit beta/citryl-CoA lyase